MEFNLKHVLLKFKKEAKTAPDIKNYFAARCSKGNLKRYSYEMFLADGFLYQHKFEHGYM